MNLSPKAGSSHGVVTKSPPVSSMESAAIRLRIAFSWMHSSAARVLDRVASAGVQQAVETPAWSLARSRALDEDRVEAAHGGIPAHARAGGASSDNEYLGLDTRHTR